MGETTANPFPALKKRCQAPRLRPFLIHTVQPVVKSHGHPVIIQVNDVNKDIYDCFPVLRAVHIANLEVEKEEFNVVVGKRRTHG